MAKRFIAMVGEEVTKEQRDQVTAFVKSKGLGFWHWVGNVWLLTSSSDDLTASTLRDSIRDLTGGDPMVMVLEVEPKTWAGFGLTGRFEWIKKNWKKIVS
ncbi:hypothetical protein [Cupriavidus sp. 2SB]|uniref:hypothetical protein n=1 Tax=Cupriavidus sp. 2SB TaxID=2502199 RepID=UPI0010F941C1|nr:hypothetical protein [Cupriavidus sp. 2SB]